MGVERVDYSSDDEYQQALQMEEWEYRQAMEKQQEDDYYAQWHAKFERLCMNCAYWNRDKEKPKCWAIKNECDFTNEKCDFKLEGK